MAGATVGSVCVRVRREVVRVPTADQIFIEFHLDGHKAFPRLFCAASRENGTNTNTSSHPPRPYTSWSLVIKLRCLICRVDRQRPSLYRGVHLYEELTVAQEDKFRDAIQPSNKLQQRFSAHALQ